MNLRKIIFIVIITFTLISCSEENRQIITSKLEPRNGLAYEPGQTEPFTGIFLEKWSNGNNKREFHFKNGVQDGKTNRWYENGQKSSEGNRKKGKPHGRQRSWNEMGRKEGEFNYKNGIKHGRHVTWLTDGNIMGESVYENGIEISSSNFMDKIK